MPAGLYTGLGWYQETNRSSLDHLELQVGIVGPAALGEQVQNAFHRLFGLETSSSWAFQLKSEPGIVLSYDHKWRLSMPVAGGLTVDAIPEFGGSAGNIYTYGEVGLMLRIGQNMNAD